MYRKITTFSDNSDLLYTVEDVFLNLTKELPHEHFSFFQVNQLTHLQKNLLLEIPQLVILDCKKFENNYQSLHDFLADTYHKYIGVAIILVVSAEFERGLHHSFLKLGVVDVISLPRFARELTFLSRLLITSHNSDNSLPPLFQPEQQFIKNIIANYSRQDLLLNALPYDDHSIILSHLAQQLHSEVIDFATLNNDNFQASLFGTAFNAPHQTKYIRGKLENYQQHSVVSTNLQYLPNAQQAEWAQFRHSHNFNRQYSQNKHQLDINFIDYLANPKLSKKYKLEAPNIHLPSLAEYITTVSLANFTHELERLSWQATLPTNVTFDPNVVSLLYNFPWQGGFAQLRYILALAWQNWQAQPTPYLSVQHLPLDAINSYQVLLQAHINYTILDLPLKAARDTFEQQYLQAQLQRFEYNVAKTAKFIGMQRPALHKKLKELNISTKNT